MIPPKMRRLWRSRALLLLLAISVVILRSIISSSVPNYRERTKGSNGPSPLEPPVCNDECLWRAGINGTWVQDWDFARDHGQYERWAYPNGPYVAGLDSKFRPSPESPFLWRTSWRWMDFSPGCGVEVMTREGLCGVLEELGAYRLMFYGDSLTRHMYKAFMNRLGDVRTEENLTGHYFTGHFACNVNDEVDPPTSSPRIIKVHCGRDEGGNSLPSSPRGVYDLDLPARQFFASAGKERTVAVFNIGVHYHNFTHYREDMARMLDILSGLRRRQDIYLFRATGPGHPGCEPRSKDFNWTQGPRIAPLKSYSEYGVDSPHRFHWDMFEAYNGYTRELLYDHNERGNGTPMHFLDTWNMTVLRRDGHTAPADCLHYIEPGPVDWWNHLLFTYLRRLAGAVTAAGGGPGAPAADVQAGNCRRTRPR